MTILGSCLYWALRPEKYFLNMGVHCMCSPWGTLTHQCFHFVITGVFDVFTEWLQKHRMTVRRREETSKWGL
jgi:hypothetical protein